MHFLANLLMLCSFHAWQSSMLFTVMFVCQATCPTLREMRAYSLLDNPSHIRLVKLFVMDSAPMRFGHDRFLEHACLSRR